MSKIDYIFHRTDELKEKDKEEFLKLFNKVFETNMNLDWFNWKYIDNIYGNSYMVFAYDKEKLIGIRSFWRNDIEGKNFQPCDTLVDKDYRGMGIFSKMSKIALEELGDYPIYNFPNQNSLPGSLKLGWKLKNHYYVKKVLSNSDLEDNTDFIDNDYLRWRFINHPLNSYYYTERGGHIYLLVKRKANFYYVLGRIDSEFKSSFEKAKLPALFYYSKKEGLMYKIFKNRANVLVYNNNNIVEHVPIYKADFF